MSNELGDFFALPAFKPDEAGVKLRRDLREFKALSEQGTGEVLRLAWRGLPVIEVQRVAGELALAASLAKVPSMRPDWQRRQLKSSGDVRLWLDEVRRALLRWGDDD